MPMIVRVLTFVIVLAASAGVRAQPPPMRDHPGVAARADALTTRLALTAAQRVSVIAILEQAERALRALRPSAREGEDVHAERQRILWDAEDRIWALLSCTQKDAYRLMERERRGALLDRMREHGHRRRGPRHMPPRRGR